MKFLCEQCKAKYQIADEKASGKTVRMKCRKCGHLIEVRGAPSESSGSGDPVGSGPSSAARAVSGGLPAAPGKPPAPRTSALATSLAAAKPQTKAVDRSASNLAGAFKSSVQREEEVSAPFDMADLSPNDEWYVAINGVPVGPVRVAEVRRKAALGAVTEESLCWQEGLDEWRPVRSFPDLAAIVREAQTSGRTSLPPSHGEGRSSVVPPPPRSQAIRPTATNAPLGPTLTPRPPPSRPAPAPVMARSNVVPFTSRLATAARLDEAAEVLPDNAPPPETAIMADPFAAASGVVAPAATQHVSALTEGAAESAAASSERKQTPWTPWTVMMIAGAVAFAVTAAIAIFVPRAAPPTPRAAASAAPSVTTAVPVPAASAAPTATETIAVPEPTSAPAVSKPAAKSTASAAASASAAVVASKGPLDLGGLGNSVRPSDDLGGDSPKVPGQCFSSGQVQTVIGLHQAAIRRSCWERNPTTKPTVNVAVQLTIGNDGSPQSVSASAEEPSVAKCVENDVKTWHFPAMGCSQPTGFSFHFVRQ